PARVAAQGSWNHEHRPHHAASEHRITARRPVRTTVAARSHAEPRRPYRRARPPRSSAAGEETLDVARRNVHDDGAPAGSASGPPADVRLRVVRQERAMRVENAVAARGQELKQYRTV